jgi:hypothetical protein
MARSLPSSVVLTLALAGVLAAGCAHAPLALGPGERVSTAVGTILLEYEPGDPGGPAVRRAVENAAPRLARWGVLRREVTVRVLRDHAALEAAIGKSGYPWLRAWATFGEIHVQSPASWTPTGASQAQTDELVLHELTHCLMYQQAAQGSEWRRKAIPVWFREGMASYTADQGYRRGSLAELNGRLADARAIDPIEGAGGIYRAESEAVYTAAHHAFVFLVQRYREEGVRRILAAMYEGRSFDAAFREAIGIDRSGFELEFRNYVLMQGWRTRPG